MMQSIEQRESNTEEQHPTIQTQTKIHESVQSSSDKNLEKQF